MKIKPSVSACICAFVALILFAVPAPGQAPAKSLKDQAIGDWQLASVMVGEAEPYGAHPKGMMYIGPHRRFSVIAMGEDRMKSIAFFGTYTVDEAEGSMTFHVLVTTSQTGTENDHKWLISFNGDEMTQHITTPTGAKGPVTTVWRRPH